MSCSLQRLLVLVCLLIVPVEALAQSASPPPMPMPSPMPDAMPMPMPSPSMSALPFPTTQIADWSGDAELLAQYEKIVGLYEAGKFDAALPLADAFLKSIKARFGEDGASYADAISILARLYQALGRYAEAETFAKRSLAIHQRDLPADHPNIVSDFGALGQLYQSAGRLDDAEPFLARALAISESAIDQDLASTGRALNNLAWLYQEQGRFGEAEPLVARSISLIEKARGQTDADFGRALDTLAKVYEGQGRVSEAEPLYRRAVAILEAARGTDYVDVAVSRENLGGLLKSIGKLDEAETLLKKAFAVKERNFGADHPLVANSLSQLGDLYRLQGKPQAADAMFRRARAIRKANIREIPVYFATDRRRESDAKSIAFSSDSSDNSLTFGQATVVLAKPPALPGRARLSASSTNADLIGSASNIGTTEVTRLAIRDISIIADAHGFLNTARKRLDTATVFKKEAFVFVHGFNVSFENAVRRTAQIAYDLNFDGAPFLFSWPGGNGVLSYLYANADSARIAADHLMSFLEKIVAETNATKIHLIAHSMGNGVLLDALDKIKLKSGPSSRLLFAEVILHSPDVASGRFRQVMTAIHGLGSGATLYASATDRALGLSAWLSGEKAGGAPSVFPGVETIDVTAAGTSFLGLNHDLYATSPAIFNDMRLLLEFGTRPPDKRSVSFQPTATPEGTYWVYQRLNSEAVSTDAVALPESASQPITTPEVPATGLPSLAPPPADLAVPAQPAAPDATTEVPRSATAPAPASPVPPVATSSLPDASPSVAPAQTEKPRTYRRKKKKQDDPTWNANPFRIGE